jgi:hypothetical protein
MMDSLMSINGVPFKKVVGEHATMLGDRQN